MYTRSMLFFMNFNFDIPVSYKLDFQNYIDCNVSQANYKILVRVLSDIQEQLSQDKQYPIVSFVWIKKPRI